MIGMALTFVFLAALFFLFERKRREIDLMDIATAVIVPVLTAFLVGLGARFIVPGIWAAIVSAIALVVATYLVLWKIAGLPVERAIGYTIAVFIFFVSYELIFASLTDLI